MRSIFETFGGVKRRFTEKTVNGTVIIDDFAHHPTEIIATIDAARQKYPSKEIVAIFQPHTFTRTIALLDEFAEALNDADAVYLAQFLVQPVKWIMEKLRLKIWQQKSPKQVV